MKIKGSTEATFTKKEIEVNFDYPENLEYDYKYFIEIISEDNLIKVLANKKYSLGKSAEFDIKEISKDGFYISEDVIKFSPEKVRENKIRLRIENYSYLIACKDCIHWCFVGVGLSLFFIAFSYFIGVYDKMYFSRIPELEKMFVKLVIMFSAIYFVSLIIIKLISFSKRNLEKLLV